MWTIAAGTTCNDVKSLYKSSQCCATNATATIPECSSVQFGTVAVEEISIEGVKVSTSRDQMTARLNDMTKLVFDATFATWHDKDVQKEESNTTLSFRAFLPDNYASDTDTYPMLVSLHGIGKGDW